MPAGPLDDSRLKAVEDSLNAGRFDDAQKRLATLASTQGLGPGLAYLSARLLFHRGRLDAESVAARLRDVLHERPDFTEAKTWLETVERSRMVTDLPPAIARSLKPTEPPPPRLETPRIPGFDFDDKTWATLGTLDLPKSELPTEPAPPPSRNRPRHRSPSTSSRSRQVPGTRSSTPSRAASATPSSPVSTSSRHAISTRCSARRSRGLASSLARSRDFSRELPSFASLHPST